MRTSGQHRRLISVNQLIQLALEFGCFLLPRNDLVPLSLEHQVKSQDLIHSLLLASFDRVDNLLIEIGFDVVNDSVKFLRGAIIVLNRTILVFLVTLD